MESKFKRTIAIFLLVCFLASVTATSVSADAKKTAGKTTTITEIFKGKSNLISQIPEEEVYKSLNVWVGNSGFATPTSLSGEDNKYLYFTAKTTDKGLVFID